MIRDAKTLSQDDGEHLSGPSDPRNINYTITHSLNFIIITLFLLLQQLTFCF